MQAEDQISRDTVVRLAAVIGCMTVFTLLLGLSYPLLTLILEKQGIAEGMIGLNAAMMPLGIIAASPFVPRWAQIIGAHRFVTSCILGCVVSFLLIGAFRDVYVWFVLRFVLGVFMSGAFVVSETWINQMAGDSTRGRVLGFYAMAISAGFALGPLLLAVTGTTDWLPFLCGAGIAALALGPLAYCRGTLPEFDHSPVSMWSFVAKAPRLLFFVFAVAAFDQVAMVFSPIYFLRNGLDEATLSVALTVLISGNIASQPAVGWMVDKVGVRITAIGCASATLLGCVILPVSFNHPVLFWSFLFVWGGAGFGLFTVSLTELGQRFTGAMLLAGNAAFGAMWGISGLLVAPLTGQSMAVFGPDGLILVIAVVFGVGFLWTAFFMREGAR